LGVAPILAYISTYSPYPYVRLVSGPAGTVNQYRIWADISATAWHTLRYVFTTSHIMYAFMDGCYIGSANGEGIPSAGYTANRAYIAPYPDTSTARTVYVDVFRMSSTMMEPNIHKHATINGATVNTRMCMDSAFGTLPAAPNPPGALRYNGTGLFQSTITYEIPLVATTDPHASNVRITTSNGTVLALQKLPTTF
jgi:hypothetical protein